MKNFLYHIHSHHSHDCCSKPEDIVKEAIRCGADILAVTDHDTWQGSLDARACAPEGMEVILGGEYLTDCGDLVALNISQEPKNREAFALIDEVHEMGGWVVLPHPYQSHQKVNELADRVDAIEGFNARCNPSQNGRAEELVQARGKPNLAASDAHFVRHISLCMNMVESTPSGFPWKVLDRRAVGSNENWMHLSQMIKGFKRRQWRPVWGGGKGLIKSSILRPLGIRN